MFVDDCLFVNLKQTVYNSFIAAVNNAMYFV